MFLVCAIRFADTRVAVRAVGAGMKSASYLGLPRRSPLDPLSLATPVDPFYLTIATAQCQPHPDNGSAAYLMAPRNAQHIKG